jgi:hypothetical protein
MESLDVSTLDEPLELQLFSADSMSFVPVDLGTLWASVVSTSSIAPRMLKGITD